MRPLLPKAEARAVDVRAGIETAQEMVDALTIYAAQPTTGASRIAFGLARRQVVNA